MTDAAKSKIRNLSQGDIPISQRRALYNQMDRRFKRGGALLPAGLTLKYQQAMGNAKERFALLKEFIIHEDMLGAQPWPWKFPVGLAPQKRPPTSIYPQALFTTVLALRLVGGLFWGSFLGTKPTGKLTTYSYICFDLDVGPHQYPLTLPIISEERGSCRGILRQVETLDRFSLVRIFCSPSFPAMVTQGKLKRKTKMCLRNWRSLR